MGPYTLEGLVKYLKGTNSIDQVKGLWRQSNGEVEFTQRAPVVKDLDAELSDYTWDLLPELTRYRAHNMHCFQDYHTSTRPDFSDVRSDSSTSTRRTLIPSATV